MSNDFEFYVSQFPKAWLIVFKNIFLSFFFLNQPEMYLVKVTLIGKGWDSLLQKENAMVPWVETRALASK